jgi:HK97 family phage portal protein
MIESREQLIRDVARIFRIPDHLIGAKGDNQTYQNVEQASLNFLTHTIAPWIRRIEIAISNILDPQVDVAFDTSTLLRTDAITRAKVNMINVSMGARTPNEVRQIEGMEPYEGGDSFNQALAGNVTAGGDLSPLGEDADPSAPVMGVLSNG